VLFNFTGITEKRLSGALVGELFANIIGDGFSRSKKGDRFYFESSQSGLTAGKSVHMYFRF